MIGVLQPRTQPQWPFLRCLVRNNENFPAGVPVFEKMRKLAEGQNHKVHAFSQHDMGFGPVCSTLVSRWVKYQMLGKGDEFWDKIEAGQGLEGGNSINQVRIKIEKIKKKHKVLEEETSKAFSSYREKANEFNTKVANSGRMWMPEKPVHGETLAKNIQGMVGRNPKKLTKSRQELFGELKVESDKKKSVHSPDINFGELTVAPKQGATFIALKKIDGNKSTGHFLGVYQDHNGSVAVFDPNLGEVTFTDSKAYTKWMNEYKKEWLNHDKYKLYSSFQATEMNGWADAQQQGRERMAMRRKLIEQAAQREREEKEAEDQALQDWTETDFVIMVNSSGNTGQVQAEDTFDMTGLDAFCNDDDLAFDFNSSDGQGDNVKLDFDF